MVAEVLGTDEVAGLTEREARLRLERDGPNELAESSGPSALELMIAQFNNVLVWVLIVAAFISGVLLNEWVDTGVILAIVVLNAVLGFTQESRAEGALSQLASMTAAEALVIRDGRERRVAAREVVAGDVVVLEAGDHVATDGRLFEAVHLETDESALTGESMPITKTIHVLSDSLGTADRRNMVFAGTIVTAGRARLIVTDTGSRTAFGQVAELLDTEEPPTPLEVELDRVGKIIALAALCIAIVIFGLGVTRNIAAETMFLTAVALAVAAIPEGLSAVVTVTLSRGVSTMARHNAIIRRLPAVEGLGAVTVICTDKTGTLTENEIRVQELEFAGHRVTDVEDGADGRLERYARVAALCNDARRREGGAGAFEGDPTEIALIRSVDPILVSAPVLHRAFPRLEEIPFDSARKAMSTLHRSEGGSYELLMKGAPELIIESCTSFEDHDGVRPLTESRRDLAFDAAARMAGDGLRTLALAYRPLEDVPDRLEEVEVDLTLIAVVGMSDHIRPEAGDAVARAHAAGIEVVMVTGDHEVTATTVGRQIGVIDDDHHTMGGAELRELPLEKLSRTIEDYRVFARVDPADKVNIVQAWQQQGAIVAMTGDGVNDAPALRSADVGIAMGSGTAVARESSAMVLADDNFATIVEAVFQGRAIFANLRKVVYFLLASNTAEVLVMLFGFILFGAYGEPLLATQLLWINLVTDGLPALALGVDPPSRDLMEQPPTSDHRFLRGPRQRRILLQGLLLALGALATFVYGYWLRDLSFPDARTLLFTSLVTTQLLHAYNARAEGLPLIGVAEKQNWALLWASLTSLTLHIGIVYTSIGQELFHTTPIAAIDWVAIAAIALASFAAVRLVTRTALS